MRTAIGDQCANCACAAPGEHRRQAASPAARQAGNRASGDHDDVRHAQPSSVCSNSATASIMPDSRWRPCSERDRQRTGLTELLGHLRYQEQIETRGDAAADHVCHAATPRRTHGKSRGRPAPSSRSQQRQASNCLKMQPMADRREARPVQQRDEARQCQNDSVSGEAKLSCTRATVRSVGRLIVVAGSGICSGRITRAFCNCHTRATSVARSPRSA